MTPRLIGAPNFRDFGGFVTVDGRRVRRGLLYRSERLSRLSDTDLEQLRPLGINLICDLRSEHERMRSPSRWPQGHEPERLDLRLNADLRAGNLALRDQIVADPSLAGVRRVMLDTYRMLPVNAAKGLGQLFERLAAGAAPVLIHCTAGKDRTGFICASIQHALGVPREDIVADYLLSAERIDIAALAQVTREMVGELEPEAAAAVNGVAAEYLDAAYASAAAQFGSFDGYLEWVGVDRKLRQQLQSKLLE
jgi:protein-tyrosine phosphatase